MKYCKPLCFFFAVFFILIFSSCSRRDSSDGKHPVFIKAENLYNEGNYKEAFEYYQRYMQMNPDSAKAAYKLALISQDNSDYVRAIYYYERFLALQPNSSDKEIIEKWIQASKKSMISQLSREFPDKIPVKDTTSDTSVPEKISELMEKNKRLKQEIEEIKTKSAAKDQKLISGEEIIPVEKQSSSSNKIEEIIYVVKSGDSLYRISKEFYGNPKYYKLIIDANYELLKGSHNIRVGDKLVIPPLKEN